VIPGSSANGRGNSRIPVLSAPQRGQALTPEETINNLQMAEDLLDRKPSMRVARDATSISNLDGIPSMILNGNEGITVEETVLDSETVVSGQVRRLLRSMASEGGSRAPAAASYGNEVRTSTRLEPATPEEDEATLAEVRELVRPLVEDELRNVRLEEKRTWQNQAMLHLQDVVAGRNGFEAGARPLSPEAGPQIVETTRRLVTKMSENASEIARLEADRRNWAAAAAAAQEAIRMREETAVEAIGEALSPKPRLHLQLAQARFMLDGNSPQLRRQLEEARERMPDSPGVAYWSAHYHIMEGQYVEAQAAIKLAPDDSRIRSAIQPILEGTTSEEPQKPHPSNFYTYQHAFVGINNSRLNTISDQLTTLEKIKAIPGGVEIPEELKLAMENAKNAAASAQAAIAAQDLAEAKEMDRADREREAFKRRAGTWKFEDENGEPHVDEEPPAVRQASSGGRRSGLKSQEEINQLIDEAKKTAETLLKRLV
jgi:hypothetical protein